VGGRLRGGLRRLIRGGGQGVLGYLVNVAGFLQIKVTSPVTHMIASALRGVLQTLVAMAVLGDAVSGGNAAGIVLVLAGSCWYTWARHSETAQAAAAASAGGIPHGPRN
jgi:solute carrier family 35 (GDP-fucose transporter), member C1